MGPDTGARDELAVGCRSIRRWRWRGVREEMVTPSRRRAGATQRRVGGHPTDLPRLSPGLA